VAKKKAKRCSSCGTEIGTAEKLCPSCRRDTGVSQTSETNGSSRVLPKKLEWQIGQARFQIDKRGASYTSPTKNPLATHSKDIGNLLTAYGIIKDSPGMTTVGLTASSQPNRTEKGWTVRWKDVREVKFNPEEHLVMLKEKWFTGGLGGGLGTLRLCCTPENYETVAATCQTFHSPTPQQTTRRSKARSMQPESATTSPAPSPPAPTYACPTCGEALTYIQQYKRWYCYKDKKYA
jgi:predicted RNA-binding Zn-ribbon protein involved in translation (DUF1610 family)